MFVRFFFFSRMQNERYTGLQCFTTCTNIDTNMLFQIYQRETLSTATHTIFVTTTYTYPAVESEWLRCYTLSMCGSTVHTSHSQPFPLSLPPLHPHASLPRWCRYICQFPILSSIVIPLSAELSCVLPLV